MASSLKSSSIIRGNCINIVNSHEPANSGTYSKNVPGRTMFDYTENIIIFEMNIFKNIKPWYSENITISLQRHKIKFTSMIKFNLNLSYME